jgi:hypothetical protein
MISVEHFEDSAEHEAGEGEVVEGGEGLREAFIVSRQPAESCGPCEAVVEREDINLAYELELTLK